MKLRLRYRNNNNVLTIDDEVVPHLTLADICSTAKGLFSNDLPRNFCLSLNKKDFLEGDDKPITDFGIINGDLIHVINLDPEPEDSPPVDTATPKVSQSTSASNSRKDNPAAGCSKDARTSEKQERNETEKESRDQEMVDMQSASEVEEEPPVDHAVVNRYLNETVYCRDSTGEKVPAVLEHLYKTAGVKSSHDALCVLLHVLMLESGYQTSDDAASTEPSISMPSEWTHRTPACTKLSYTHNSCSDMEATFTLTCVPMCSLVVVHGTSVGQNRGQQVQLQLNTGDYINSLTDDAVRCYKQLNKLSRIFKDTVALPMLQSFQEANGMLPISGIMALSHEIKLKIMGYLDVVSVLNCSLVCKEFNNLSKDRSVWRKLHIRDFPNHLPSDTSLSRDWLELYKRQYRQRKERRKMLSQMTMIVPGFYPPVHRPLPMPQGPFYPGILGGDYDLNPQFPMMPGPGFGPGFGPSRPNMRPRFDPVGPLPEHNIFPNRRGPRGPFGGFGGGGPKFF